MTDSTSHTLQDIPVGHYQRVMETGHPSGARGTC